jgi:ATP-binding cassette subfamily B protein
MKKNRKKLTNEHSFLRNMLFLLSPYKSRIIVIFSSMIIGAVATAVTPLVNRAIIDQGIVALDFTMLLIMLGVLALLFIIERGMDALGFWQILRVNRNFIFRLTVKAQNHLMKLPVSYFKDNQETQIINNLQMDIGKVSLITDRFILMVIVQVFGILGAVVGLAIIDPGLLLIVLAVLPIKILVVRFFAKRHEKYMEKYIKLHSFYNALHGDIVSNMEILKLWNLRRRKLRNLTVAHKDILHNNIKISANDKISEILDILIGFILNIVIYVVGFIGIMNGRLTIGGLFAFMAYSSQIINPVSMLAQVQHYIADIKPSLKRHIEFLEIPEEEVDVRNKIDKIEVPEEIIFSNVSLKYSDKTAIDNINLRLLRGQMTAIVGENGSGKSSLIQLLLRLEEPTDGSIYFDDTKVDDFRVDNYRNLFAVIRQNVNLFAGSVRENVDPYGSSSDSKILSRFEFWGVKDLVYNLSEGLDTEIGQEGSKLSGGERQKLTAVRAGLKDAKILILDEATANYDKESEQLFNRTLNSKLEYDYVIIITHQEDVLDNVDRIIRIDEGRIVEDIFR